MRVLVTRPEPGAGRTVAKLRAMGFEPVVLPLSETTRLAVAYDAVPGDAAAVAVTSGNAIRHAPPELIRRLAALPCHAVGRRTADAARAAGFSHVLEGPGDAIRLAEAIGPKLTGKVLAYLCGRHRFPGFEERLAAAGVQVHPIETYDTVAIDHSDESVLSILARKPANVLLLYSAKAADAARGLAARPALQALLGRAEVYALSHRIADAYGSDVRVAPMPTEEALLALLASGG